MSTININIIYDIDVDNLVLSSSIELLLLPSTYLPPAIDAEGLGFEERGGVFFVTLV
jgi:hypothetical protein